jgi:hypothetical protein
VTVKSCDLEWKKLSTTSRAIVIYQKSEPTLLPFSMRARSQTATSAANLLKSRTLVSSSVVHLFTISSRVLPLSMDGRGIATTGGAAVLSVGAAVLGVVVLVGLLGIDANNQSET